MKNFFHLVYKNNINCKDALIASDAQLSALQLDHAVELHTLESLLMSAQNEAILSIHTHNEKVLQALKAKHNDDVKLLNLNHEESTEVLRCGFEAQIEAQDAEGERRMMAGKNDHKLQVEQSTEKHSFEITAINEKHVAATDTLKIALKKDLLSAQDGYTQLVDKLQAVHHQEMHILLTRHSDEKGDIKHQHMLARDALYTKEISQVEGLLRAQEDQLVAVRAEAEREGYERAALAYREQAEVLRCDLESRHEGDLDALSEEAVRATNRLKAKLSAMELKQSQMEESRSQLLEGEVEMKKMKERIREVEGILKAQEEVWSDSTTYTQLESAREVGMVTLRMEGLREKIQAECDTLRQSEKQASKALESLKKESDKALFEINLHHDAFTEGLQRQLLDSSLVNARLRHDLQTQHDFSRTLQGDVESCREASLLVSELSEKLKQSLQDKAMLTLEMSGVKEEKIKLEATISVLEKHADVSMQADSHTPTGTLSATALQEALKAEKGKRYSFLIIFANIEQLVRCLSCYVKFIRVYCLVRYFVNCFNNA